MAKFRLEALANLARQLSFTPLVTRAAQINSAEVLLHDLQPEKAYPIDFVVFRITGYQPKTDANSDLLTGLALQHDLGLLIEQVSDGLNLDTTKTSEPVLSIDDVTERFDVTSKTIQRWRRRGLPARRFTFTDGKRRVGFLLSSVERFIAAHRDQLGSTTLCTTLLDDEQSLVVRHARRLARDCGCSEAEISLRIGKKLHRTPMTVLHTLRKHDALHPDQAVLPLAAPALSEDQVARVISGAKRGLGIKRLARKVRRSRSIVYRTLVQDRVARLNKRKIRFIDDPLYHQPDAAHAIADIVSQDELGISLAVTDTRVPRDLPPYLSDLYRTPLLSPARERALFLKFNFHKSQFVLARRRLEPEFAGGRDLAVLEQHLRYITQTKNEILQANLPAGRQRRPPARSAGHLPDGTGQRRQHHPDARGRRIRYPQRQSLQHLRHLGPDEGVRPGSAHDAREPSRHRRYGNPLDGPRFPPGSRHRSAVGPRSSSASAEPAG